jgi:alkaline phosphatase D
MILVTLHSFIESIDYSKFIKSTPVIGMWDDHDYGANNGDRSFPKKKQVRDIFLDFINEPKNSSRYLDKDSPIHQDYVIITPDKIKIHLLLVDVRYEFDRHTRERFGE